MPTNKFFTNFDDIAEQRLYNDLINETVYTYGIDCQYLPRESSSSVDLLFGEDPTSVFTSAFPVAVYVQSVDNFEGGEIFSKFGIEVRKQARFLITKDSFNATVSAENQNNYLGSPNVYGSSDVFTRPREGDLLWMSNFNALFEIKYVDEEYFFYTFGNNKIYGWSMVCEKFRYSNERVETGVVALDTAIENVVVGYAYTMANTYNSSSYQIGEPVWQGTNAASATASATILDWNQSTLTLMLKDIQGLFITNTAIVGANSGAQFNLVSDNLLQQVNPNIDNNEDVANEGEDVINWSESNPFGETE
jgi:hypothetical protein